MLLQVQRGCCQACFHLPGDVGSGCCQGMLSLARGCEQGMLSLALPRTGELDTPDIINGTGVRGSLRDTAGRMLTLP